MIIGVNTTKYMRLVKCMYVKAAKEDNSCKQGVFVIGGLNLDMCSVGGGKRKLDPKMGTRCSADGWGTALQA